MNDKKEYNSLLDKLLKYDTDGVIINELVNQNFVDLMNITNFVIDSNKFEYIYFIIVWNIRFVKCCMRMSTNGRVGTGKGLTTP